jgi:para-nitrobenzyl esterase
VLERSTGLTVEVTGGSVEGTVRRGLRMWRGMPYAATPDGHQRFRAPVPVEAWNGIRDASSFGPVAPQDRNGQFLGPKRNVPMSEDCLTVNVIAPDEVNHELPVMVFIHGGAYSVGSAREVPYLGEGLVRRGGIIFVNFNYRLGALGYLDFSSYATREHPIDSNLGLRDQLAALEWVRDNIAAFGGDPQNVTLFGESAGGNAVTTLMAVPRAEGLFARAIAQSPPPNAVYLPELTATWAGEFLELLSELVDDSDTESTARRTHPRDDEDATAFTRRLAGHYRAVPGDRRRPAARAAARCVQGGASAPDSAHHRNQRPRGLALPRSARHSRHDSATHPCDLRPHEEEGA